VAQVVRAPRAGPPVVLALAARLGPAPASSSPASVPREWKKSVVLVAAVLAPAALREPAAGQPVPVRRRAPAPRALAMVVAPVTSPLERRRS
jgi:hypothetical protein